MNTSAQPAQQQPGWMDLKTLSAYCCISVRELRDHIKNPIHPLPAYTRGKKLYVNRDEFDHWFRTTSKRIIAESIDQIVKDVCSHFGVN